MPLLILALVSLFPAAGGAKAAAPHYFTAVYNGAYDFKGGAGYLEDSYKALEKMAQLADTQQVRLTLLFSAQYADFISSSPARLAALEGWKNAGHEVGAYHQGPDTKSWDGYSDLPRGVLLKMLKEGKAPARVPDHHDYFAALGRLAPEIKSGCMGGSADREFLSAAPGYELCSGAGKNGSSPQGVNGFIFTAPGAGGMKKRLSASYPSDRAGIEAAKKAFSSMEGGVYGASFKSSPSEFGAFYAWLRFLKEEDPQGARSRTVAGAVKEKLIPEKTLKAAAPARALKSTDAIAPAEAQKPELPRLKPKPSPFSRVERLFFGRFRQLPGGRPRGYCGDGLCGELEKRQPGRCLRDCGK